MGRISRPDAVAVLEDELAKKNLRRYFSVLQNEKPAKFMMAKQVPAEWDETDSLEMLWMEHAKRTNAFQHLRAHGRGARARTVGDDIHDGLHYALSPLSELDHFSVERGRHRVQA